MAVNREGFAGLLGLVITLAIILIMASMYFTLTGRAPADNTEPGADQPGGVVPAIRAAHQAELTVRLVEVRQAVAAFQALEGTWPPSLEAVRQAGFMINPAPEGYTYTYDPATGDVNLRPREKPAE